MGTVLTGKTEGLNPPAPPTVATTGLDATVPLGATSDLVMTIATATHTPEAEEVLTRGDFEFTTRILHLPVQDTSTMTRIARQTADVMTT